MNEAFYHLQRKEDERFELNVSLFMRKSRPRKWMKVDLETKDQENVEARTRLILRCSYRLGLFPAEEVPLVKVKDPQGGADPGRSPIGRKALARRPDLELTPVPDAVRVIFYPTTFPLLMARFMWSAFFIAWRSSGRERVLRRARSEYPSPIRRKRMLHG